VTAVEDHARTTGTTVLVERLFFNAPARARFLRAPAAETRAVQDALVPLALAHPEVAFLLVSDERVLLELPTARDLVERIAGIWGDEAAGELLALEAQGEGLTLKGVVQRPDRVRPGFRRAHLFVDGRPFRDPSILRAADRGYRTTIPPDHRPWVFLEMGVPAGSVDVNVHPTKAEVRFRDRAAVERVVEEGVRTALEGVASAATFQAGGGFDRSAPVRPAEVREGASTGRGRGAAADDTDQMASNGPASGRSINAWIVAEVREWDPSHRSARRARTGALRTSHGPVRPRERSESQRLLFPLTDPPHAVPRYDMVQDLKGNASPDRIRGGVLRGRHRDRPGRPGSSSRILMRKRCRSGRSMDELTHGSELVRSARNQHERVAMSFACKAAVKAGDPLDDREIQELFDQLFGTRAALSRRPRAPDHGPALPGRAREEVRPR
jgi:DNA mismatch repair protein MutL